MTINLSIFLMNGFHYTQMYVALCVGILLVVIVVLTERIIMRRRKIYLQNEQTQNVLQKSLELGHYFVTFYDLKTGICTNMHGQELNYTSMPSADIFKFIHPDYLDSFNALTKRLTEGETTREELKVLFNQGGTPENPNWVMYKGVAMSEQEEGKVTSIVHIFADVTEEDKEERANHELTDRMQKAFDSNIIAMAVYDKEGKPISANEQMRQLIFSTEENEHYFRNMNLFDIPCFVDLLDFSYTDTINFCQNVDLSYHGIKGYVEFRVRKIYNDKGEHIMYVVAVRGLSEERNNYLAQRAHEKEMMAKNQVIKRRDEQLRNVLENSKMFIWWFDIKQRTTYFSQRLHSPDFQVTPEDVARMTCEEDRERIAAELHQKLLNHEPIHTIIHFDYTPVDDKPTWYSVSGFPHFDENGELAGYYGVNRNVDDLMQAQIRLKEETERAENSGRLKSSFLANMTHEIRTPLNAIVGFSELLQMESDETERKEYIQIIHDNCDMLIRLLNDFLEASKMDEKMDFAPVDMNVPEVFDEICQKLELRVHNPNVIFIKDNPSTSLSAFLDKERLTQVLINFVTNAVKYTSQGYIKVGYRQEGDHIIFYCEDTGIGIPKEKQDAIFNRFVQLDEFAQGTGLGLSICKNIIEQFGGTIGVKSEGTGKGSTFWISLPRDRKDFRNKS